MNQMMQSNQRRQEQDAPDPLDFFQVLRCPGCRGGLAIAEQGLLCLRCHRNFPIVRGIPRMLLPEMREALGGKGDGAGVDARKVATAESFGFEWSHFPDMYDEWERNFFEYMSPRGPEFFRGKRVLDAGCGSGRHSYYAAKYGADVWAVDLGQHVEVARRNTISCDRVHVIQADLHDLPFAPESFDFIYSIGVLHHLPDPETGFRSLLQYLKPGGEIQIYLYWEPEGQPVKTALLSAVAGIRKLTTRLPNAAIYALSYPAAWLAFVSFVWPYRALRLIPQLRGLAERMPMKQYSNYPFRVCVNDQFDRFSAPIENRYTKAEVEDLLRRAGLNEINVQPNCGWGGSGKKSSASGGSGGSSASL